MKQNNNYKGNETESGEDNYSYNKMAGDNTAGSVGSDKIESKSGNIKYFNNGSEDEDVVEVQDEENGKSDTT